MKIGVMSDSHDNLPNIRRAVDLFATEGAECLIHAGDFVAPFAVREILKFPGQSYGCFGNNDGERAGIRKLWAQVYDPPHELVLGGRRILLMHDLLPPEQWPSSMRTPEVVIYGHTHDMVVKKEPTGPLYLNPGEAGGWLRGHPSVAILETETLEVRVMEL